MHCRLTSIAEYTGEHVSTGESVSNEPDVPREMSTKEYKSHLPVGVIVGAAVGGVLAIALLCAALLLLRRRAHTKGRARRGLPDVRDEHEALWALSEMSEQPKTFMLMDSPVYEERGRMPLRHRYR